MKSKIVTIKELTTDNPTLCLSALRVFNECHKCLRFISARRQNTIEKMKCKPHINPQYFELIGKKRKLLDQLSKINKEMESL